MQESNNGFSALSFAKFSSKEAKILCIAGALVVLVLVYIRHFANGFFYDDVYLIQENLSIKSLKNIPKFFTDIHYAASRPEYQNQYRPFFQTSFAIDYYLGKGLSPLVMHIHTFIGFVVLALMVFLLGLKIFKGIAKDPFYPALFSACCFAFHPATADVVSYLYARTNSFATLYGMLYFISYLNLPLFRKYHFYLIPLIIGCLFKSIAIVFVPLLWLYIIFFEQEMGLNNIFKAIKNTWKAMLPACLTIILAMVVVSIKSAAKVPEGSISYYTHFLTQTHVILNYFSLFFLPENLNPNGWRDFVTSPFNTQFLTGLVFIVASIILIYIFSLKKSTRPLAYGLAWFFIALIPTVAFIPLLIPQVDYYMFTSIIGLAFCMGGVAVLLMNGLQSVKGAKAIVAGLCIFFLLGYSYMARSRTNVWGSQQAMWEDVVKKDPTNGRVLMNLGVYLMAQNKLNEANDYFERARVYYPNYDLVYVNLGILKNQLKDTVTANADFRIAVQLNGWDHYEACFFYARFLSQWGHDDAAIPLLQQAVKEYPSYLDAWNLLLSIYLAHHDSRMGEATRKVNSLFPGDDNIVRFCKIYASDSTQFSGNANNEVVKQLNTQAPTEAVYIQLSLVYFKNGEFEKCIDACKKAITLNPNSAIAYNNICSAYNNLHKWDEAIEAGNMALKLQPDFTLAKNNLNFAISQKKAGK